MKRILVVFVFFSQFLPSPLFADTPAQSLLLNQTTIGSSRKAGQHTEIPVPKAEEFKGDDGKLGWRIRIPGGRPLATPAVVDGMLFVGGGFGSHEFYALDAKSGKAVWTYRTGDDGPTAAVVADGYVAYNTESCTVYVHEAKTGKLLWHRWLGDPLMSQPAIANGNLYMAYPGPRGTHYLAAFTIKKGDPVWKTEIAGEIITAPIIEGSEVITATVDGTLYRFNAENGELLWKKAAKITSAPRVSENSIIVSQRSIKTIELPKDSSGKVQRSEVTLEGFNLIKRTDGSAIYQEPRAAVEAAYLLNFQRQQEVGLLNSSQLAFGQTAYRYEMAHVGDLKRHGGDEAAELVDKIRKKEKAESAEGALQDAEAALQVADELEKLEKRVKDKDAAQEYGKASKTIRSLAEKTKLAAKAVKQVERSSASKKREETEEQKFDSLVGFSQAPAAAKLYQSWSNIGVGNVKAVWAYQGSRPLLYKDSIILVHAEKIQAVKRLSGEVIWMHSYASEKEASRPLTPPALAGGKLYLGTADGFVLCLDPASGKTLWKSKVGGHILFEPAVVGGAVYAATNDGTLIRLETGDSSADGWAMWGGAAHHNG